MNVLYIYGGSEDKTINTNSITELFLYKLGSGNINGTKVTDINNSSLLNEIATNSSKDYCEFIFSINKLFLRHEIIYKQDFSLYFLGDISGKRTEFFNTYSNYCNSILIQGWLKDFSVDKVIIDNCCQSFEESLSSVFKLESEIEIEIINSTKYKSYNYFKALISGSIFFANVFIGFLFNKVLFKKNKLSQKVNNLFLTRFPLHLNYSLFEDKYDKLVKENDFYLVHLFTDGMHQKTSFIQYVRYLFFLKNKKNILILDKYIALRDILKMFFLSFLFSYKYKKLSSLRYIHNGIDLTTGIIGELNVSFARSMRLLMWRKSIYRLCESVNILNLYYYLHEYSYGRLFTLSFKKYSPKTSLIGYQSGPSSKRKLLYMAAKDELSVNYNFLESFPVPDFVLAEEEYSARIYREAGYVNVSLMDKIYRLGYLKDLKRIKSKEVYILIAPGLHDGKFMMEKMEKTIINLNKYNFLLKPHPRGVNDYIDKYKKFENLEVSKLSIMDLLSKVSKVYATYSSVAVEAKLLGIDVELINLPGKINESPLIDSDFKFD